MVSSIFDNLFLEMDKKIFIKCILMKFLFLSLHPGDLYPYTRKPLFLICDSDNSSAFQVSVKFFLFVTVISTFISSYLLSFVSSGTQDWNCLQ